MLSTLGNSLGGIGCLATRTHLADLFSTVRGFSVMSLTPPPPTHPKPPPPPSPTLLVSATKPFRILLCWRTEQNDSDVKGFKFSGTE